MGDKTVGVSGIRALCYKVQQTGGGGGYLVGGGGIVFGGGGGIYTINHYSLEPRETVDARFNRDQGFSQFN